MNTNIGTTYRRSNALRSAKALEKPQPFGSTAYYNGNIARQIWASGSATAQRRYDYRYDALGRLTQADFTNPTDAAENYDLMGLKYDPNGNIMGLNQYGLHSSGGAKIYKVIDSLAYTYTGNRLMKVADKATTAQYANGDFRDGSNLGDDYTYNLNGSLMADMNKGIDSILYNHLNLPKQVKFTNGNRVEYTYDAAGVKMQKRAYESGLLTLTTDYLGEFVYENNTLSFIHTPEGRLLPRPNKTLLTENGTLTPTPTKYTYEYHHKDHLGNLRVAFRKESAVVRATMEDSCKVKEGEYFEQMQTRLPSVGRGGSYAAALRGDNAQKTMGPATVVAVKKGDKINISAYSKYTSTSTTFTATATTVGTVKGTGISENGIGAVVGSGLSIPIGPIIESLTSRPRAYARLVFVDENGKNLQNSQQLIASGAGNWKTLALSSTAPKDCYAVVFVANESPTDVFFDDIEVTHERLIWQENHYYPFGLEIKPLTREGWPNHRFTYNGKEFEEETGWSDYGARRYDEQISRWIAVDPLAEKYHQYSEYSFVGGNPIKNREIDGRYWVGKDGKEVNVFIRENGKIKLGKNASSDLKRYVKMINKSGSTTAVNQFQKVAQNETKVNFKIEVKPNGTLLGLHQAHDKDGSIKWTADSGGTGTFERQPDYITDKNNKLIYREATITIYKTTIKNNTNEMNNMGNNPNNLTANERLVSVGSHEIDHNTNTQAIDAIRKRQGGEVNNYDVEEPAYLITRKVLGEIINFKKSKDEN